VNTKLEGAKRSEGKKGITNDLRAEKKKPRYVYSVHDWTMCPCLRQLSVQSMPRQDLESHLYLISQAPVSAAILVTNLRFLHLIEQYVPSPTVCVQKKKRKKRNGLMFVHYMSRCFMNIVYLTVHKSHFFSPRLALRRLTEHELQM
jgi:hypothetical protein